MIGNLIRRSALQFGDAPCLSEAERTLSFRDFDRATDRVGNALLARGLRPGDRVGIALPNSIDCVVAYYGASKAGLVRVQLNLRETLDSHLYKLSDSGARGVIHNDVPGIAAEISIGRAEIAEMISDGPDAPCVDQRGLDDLLRLAYTGGTTGKPKAAMLSFRTDLIEMGALISEMTPDLGPGDQFLHAAPIAHASGAMFLPTLVRGAESVMMTKFDPTEFLQLAERTQASHAFLVPTMLAMIMADPGVESARTAFQRICYAGSSIAPALVRRAEERFGRVLAQTYGQAESPMCITRLRPEEHDRAASCGRPYPFIDVCIMNDDGEMLPQGERGEICCRGPQTMVGYWNRPEETKKTFRGGWLHTGDLGYMDEDGFFYIVDRKNDMFISGGFNIYPREVEDVMMEFPGVSEVAVVGLPDDKWGQQVAAAVSGVAGLDATALEAFARENLAGFKRPRRLEIWPELPKSGAGKVLRRTVRDQMIGATEDAPGGSTS